MNLEDITRSFLPERVCTDNGLQAALARLGRLTEDAERHPGLMEEFLDVVLKDTSFTLAPFVLLHLGLYIEDPNYLVDLIFPEQPNTFPTSVAHRLLCALRDFFFTAVPSLDMFKDASQIHIRVSNAAILLKDLATLEVSLPTSSLVTMSPTSPTFDSMERDEAVEFGYHIKVKNKKQGKEKNAAAMVHRYISTHATPINDRAFLNLGVAVPLTAEDAKARSDEILLEQKGILIRYIGLLHNEEVEPYIKSNHLQGQTASATTHAKKERQPSMTGEYEAAAESATPSAPSVSPDHSAIFPLKPARYYEGEGAEPGEWHVFLAARALKQIRTLARGDAAIFGIVNKKISELSQGYFSDSNQKHLAGNVGEVPIYEAKLTRNLRLVYQVDCGTYFYTSANGTESSYEQQQLVIYGVFTDAKLDQRFWALLASQSPRRGPEYRRRCIYRQVPRSRSQGLNVIPPAVFPPLEEEDHTELIPGGAYQEADYLELHAIIALEKFIPYSHTLLDTIRSNQTLAYVFNVSPKEEEIVYHSSSCLVIGRSGTGKTTTMLFKMIALERAAELNGTKIRQIFVTQSRVLARRVEEYFGRLIATSRPAPARLGGGKVKEGPRVGTKFGEELIGYDNEADEDERLPTKWSELQDSHFPLFLTFNQLCRLLEGDCFPASKNERRTRRSKQDSGLNEANHIAAQHTPRGGLLTFEQFLDHFWPHFHSGLTQRLDPALVFGEFMGVIRGCEEALATPNGYIDRETYEGMSTRTQMTFARFRPRIYSLFELYMKQKRLLRYYDAPERTHALLKAVANGVPGQPIDFLYVDEAQDNLIIDAGLLRSLCRSPHGLFFAGDTAQTIAVGSSFRFDALKAYLWRMEKSDPLVQAGKRQAIHPALFQLSVNYRSHKGIVNAAASVVRLILDLFPESIDDMNPEKGMVDGPKPILFTDCGGDLRFKRFLQGNENIPIEFGADQAILVRNEATQKALGAEIGQNTGQIFTLFESKGLEFNDVLLYNFFADSPCSAADWRVVLNCLTDQVDIAAPEFDDARHAGIQSELKFLYVGLTRARKHIWIWDSSSIGDALKTFWTSKDLIDVCGRNDPMPQLAVASSSEDWAERGRHLFAHKRYPQSLFCFERAGMPLETAIVKAYNNRQNAQRLSARDAERSSTMVAAAVAFESAASLSAKMPSQKRKLLRAAAECFLEAGRRIDAAKLYYEAEAFTDSAIQYRKANVFDEAVKIVQSHRSQMKPTVADEIMSVSRFFYAKSHQIQKAEELFDGVDEHIKFLEDYGLDEARATVLESHDRFEEAGELQLQMGNESGAIDFFLKSTNASTRKRAASTILDVLCKRFFLGAPVDIQKEKSTTHLLDLGRPVLLKSEMAMFHAIQSNDRGKLMQLGRQFAESGDDAYALVVYDRALQDPPSFDKASVDELIQVLGHYWHYRDVVKRLRGMSNVAETAGVQRILRFVPLVDTAGGAEPVSAHYYLVPQESVLFTRAASSNTLEVDNNGNATLPLHRVELFIRMTLSGRYNAALNILDDRIRMARALQPCIEHAAGLCSRHVCYREHALKDASEDFWLSKRVRAMALIIILLNDAYAEPGKSHISGRFHIQRVWLSKLFQTFHPVVPVLGSLANVDIRFPEYKIFLPILKNWLQDRLNNLDPRGEKTYQHFLGDVISMSLLAYTLDHVHASHYVSRAPWATMQLPLLLDPQSNRTVVEEALMWFTGKRNYSLGMGVSFIRKIAQNRNFFMDINSFTAYIESIVAHLVINRGAASAFKGNAALHRITLPKTWAVSVIARSSPYDRIPRESLLFEALDSLLMDLLNPASDHQYFLNRKPLRECHDVFRSYFVARLCKALVILGYNHDSVLQIKIVTLFNRLPRMTQLRHPSFDHYMMPQSWTDLLIAMRKPILGSTVEELCTFMHVSQPRQTNSLPGIRFVYYKTKADLLTQISAIDNPIVPTWTPDSRSEKAAETLQQKVGAEATGGSKVTPGGTEVHNGYAGDFGQEHNINVGGSFHALIQNPAKEEGGVGSVTNEDAFGVKRTSEEEAAAERIQTSWTRSRKEVSKTGNHFYMECVRRLAQWGPAKPILRRYKLFYLGPLPHVLFYLEKVEKSCTGKKKKVQNWLKEEVDPDENLMSEVVELASLERKIQSLRHKVRPSSDLHQACSVTSLKLAVRGIEALKVEIDRLLPNQHESTTLEYNLGWKGLLKVAEKKQKPKPRRPTLNAEDLDF
ncbi:hypothetical protein FRB93_008309 [Tulasnella sp. JGI-2019a]|nr:hypothetical protein FRB93_008309 [Tulasnella sp. JGI-2019a]